MNNLQTYVDTGSRQVIDLNGASTGGGQYDTISNWLVDLASSPVIAPDGDLGHAFDNNQKIGKTWHVEFDSKVKASVITTHIWLSLDKTGLLQSNEKLKPVQWCDKPDIIKKIRDAEDPVFLELEKVHYNSLYHILESNIKSVLDEQLFSDSEATDFIDEKIERESGLVCNICEKMGLTISYPKTQKQKRNVTFAIHY